MKNLYFLLFTFLITSLSSGQGTENFDNFTETGQSYSSGTFTGQDGSTWTYVQSRGDQSITDKSIMLGRNRSPQAEVYSGSISGGVGTINFNYQRAFSTNVNLNILVNDVVVGNVSSTDGTVQNSGTITVNEPGNVVLKFISVNNSDGQVTIDDISWTSFPSNCNQPTDITVSNITSDSAEISWSANESVSFIEIVPTGETPEGPEDPSPCGPGPCPPGAYSNPHTIADLETSMTYDVYLASLCCCEYSELVGPVTFTTLACTPPTDITVSNITSDSAEISSSANETFGFIEIVPTGETPEGPEDPSPCGPCPPPGYTEYPYTIAGLETSMTYDVYLASLCNSGYSELAGPVTFTTLACTQPTNITTTNITFDSVEISWNNDTTSNSWEIEYGPIGFSQGTGAKVTANSNPYVLSSLTANTPYDIYVSLNCGNTQSDSVGPFTIQTDKKTITDANFQEAVNTCLSINPIDGMCSSSEYGAMPNWDVSQVTNMQYAFEARENFNANIINWDVSNVTNMSGMFISASSFNQPLNNWDVSSVTSMAYMFYGASFFNQPLTNWDVSSVTSIAYMFFEASFNQSLNDWDVSNVTNMQLTFSRSDFNQPINDWDTGNVENMQSMFSQGSVFNQSVNNWNTSKVISMDFMFYNNSSFNQPFDNWDVSSVTSMTGMFTSAASFNQPLDNWDVSSVTNMSGMLDNSGLSTDNYDVLLNSWSQQAVNQDVSLGAQDVYYCNDSADARQSLIVNNGWAIEDGGIDYESGCTTPITDANFQEAINTCLSINPIDGMCSSSEYGAMPNWDVSRVTNMQYAFEARENFNANIINWDVSNVTNMSGMFISASSFNQPLTNWDVSSVTSMDYMFYGASSFNQPLTNWDVSSVTNIAEMFRDATSFNQPLNNWDVSSVTAMNTMFYNASSFNQPLDNWDVSSVINMAFMFRSASSFNQPLNNWNVSNVTNMFAIFSRASSFNQPLDNWDVSSVTNIDYMFYNPSNSSSFNQPLNNWDVSNVTSMAYMFYGASSFNQPLTNWDVSSVTSMGYMFYGASSFNQPLTNWNLVSVLFMNSMLDNSGLTTDNYDALLNSWSLQDVQQNVQFGAVGVNYCFNGSDARQSLIDNNGWIITDEGLDLGCVNCLKVKDANIYLDFNNNVEIILDSREDIKGFQFDINFPEGFTFDTEKITKLEIPEAFNLSAANINDNVYRIIGFSLSNETIPPGNISLISLPVVVDLSIPTGDYVIPVTDLILSDINNVNVLDLCTGDGILTLNEDPSGDANGDSNINILDILATIDYIFGNPPATFFYDFANINFDNTINILDVLGIQDIILAPDTFSAQDTKDSKDVSAGINYLIVEDNLIEPNSSDIIAINLNNEDIVKGLQFDFVLPDGVTLIASEISATSRLDGFNVSAQEIATDTFRVLIFSLSSATIDIGTESIINLPVFIEQNISDGAYPVALTDVTISDINNIDIATIAPSIGEITIALLSITDIKFNYKLHPNPTSHTISIEGNTKALEVVIYDVLGKELIQINTTNSIDVSAFENGIYFLKLSDGVNTSTHKIIKK